MSSNDSQPFQWHFTADLTDNNFKSNGRTLFFVLIIFVVIVLITVLSLYSRWVCRYHHHHFPTHQQPNPAHAPPSRPHGLHPSIINMLPVTLHQSSSSPSPSVNVEAECCICLGVFEDGDKVKTLPVCHHFFHSECLDRWLATKSSCPLCRASFQDGCSALVSILTE